MLTVCLLSMFTSQINAQLLSCCCCCLLLSCFLCSLSMSSSVMSSFKISGIKNSSLTIFCGRCLSLSRVSYIPNQTHHRIQWTCFLLLTGTFPSDTVRQGVFDEDQRHSEQDLDSFAEEHVPDPQDGRPWQCSAASRILVTKNNKFNMTGKW